MSVILDALYKLEQSIGNLEGAASHVEATLAGQQRDMFGGARSQAPANGNGADNVQSIDPQAIVQKLDNIIEQAETVLREGHG